MKLVDFDTSDHTLHVYRMGDLVSPSCLHKEINMMKIAKSHNKANDNIPQITYHQPNKIMAYLTFHK